MPYRSQPVKFELSQPHRRSLADLKAHAQTRLDHWAAKYPHLDLAKHFRWEGERVVRGSYQGGTGSITLGDDSVRVELDLPFFARPFRGRIEEFVRRELAML